MAYSSNLQSNTSSVVAVFGYRPRRHNEDLEDVFITTKVLQINQILKLKLELIYYFTYFSTVVPSNSCEFLFCKPFVVTMTFSTGLVGVENVLTTKALQERNTQLLDGTTVEKIGKIINSKCNWLFIYLFDWLVVYLIGYFLISFLFILLASWLISRVVVN